MKKALSLITVFALMFILMVGCTTTEEAPASQAPAEETSQASAAESGEEEAAAPSGEHKIGMSMTSQAQQRWNMDAANFKALCEEAGYECVVTFANDDSVQQAADIENLVAQGCDVLAVCPVDTVSLDLALKSAREAGVWIIAYDRPIDNTEYVDYHVVSANINDIGPMQANFFIEHFKLDEDDGNTYTIEFFAGSPTEQVASLWLDDTVEILQPYMDSGKLECRSGQTTFEACAISNWDSVEAQSRMENLLTAFYSDGTPPDMIISPNDSIALGIVNALQRAGYEDPENFPAITGQDCDIANIQLMVQGFIAHNIFKDIFALGGHVLNGIEAHYAGEEPPTNSTENNGATDLPAYEMDMVGVTPDNWYEVLVEGGFYTLEDLGLTEADIPA